MTKEEIKVLEMDEVETRVSEIIEETRDASPEELDAIAEELDAIEERKAEIKSAAEEKRAVIDAVIEKAEVIEEPKEERKVKMSDIEIRKSAEYLDAWVESLKGKASEEQRALLTVNATNGTIAVPVYVEDKINTAWENNDLMRRIRRTYFKGNLKVGYEASASGAVVHTEGSGAVTEEELVLGFIELIPKTIKKMVKYSTEVMDMKGEAWVDYIFDEVTYQIVLKAVSETINAMHNSGIITGMTFSAPITTGAIIAAEGQLGGEATNPVFITTRQTAAGIKAAALSAGYAYDPFDGLEVIYATMPENVFGYVADLTGVQANFPNGDQVNFVFDEYTDAPSDLVRVIGRLMMAVDVVAPGKVIEIGGE